MSATSKPTAASSEARAPLQAATLCSDSFSCDRQLGASERLASLGILAAGVAHEIMNPLASVLAGIEALRRRCAEAPRGPGLSMTDADRILDMLEQEIGRARDIANRMMLLARPDSEALSWLDVNRAVEDTVALLRHQMNVQDIRTNLALDPRITPIWVREGGMRGVLMNLMMNAVQAMSRGGELTIRTHSGSGTLSIEVEDTGPGIPADRLNRIWDPFYTTKPPGEGTGLGLSISQTVVQQHGGSIGARNVEPHGARFTVAIPADSGR